MKKKTASSVSLQNLNVVLRTKLHILIPFGIIMLVIASFLFYRISDRTASVVMSLNYEQSTRGLEPNATRFSISEIRSEEVAEKALDDAGLTGMVSAEELIDCINITPYASKSVDKGESYIATSFKITYTKCRNLSNVDAEVMLECIMKAYKDLFYDKYIIKTDIFKDVDSEKYANMEFYQIADDFKFRLENIESFLKMRIGENTGFISEQTGQTFKQLMESCRNIESISYMNFRSFIWEHGIVRNPDVSRQVLEYRNFRLTNDYNAAMDAYQIRKTVIDTYQDAMTASVLIPSYDNRGEFYMARAKIGIDKLALEAEEYLDQANMLRIEMDQNDDMQSKINDIPDQNQIAEAEQIAKNVDEQITALEQLIHQTDIEYQNKTTRNYLSFLYGRSSFWEKLQIQKAIVITLVLTVALYLLFYVKYCVRQKT